MKPIVKWAGGKTRLLPELMARVPSSFGQYFEPFVGGAALYLHLKQEGRIHGDPAVLADLNPDLIHLYRVLGQGIDLGRFMRVATLLQRTHCREDYYQHRALWNSNKPTDPIERAATFLYLNKACFNGLWRVNSKGEFNTPCGDKKALAVFVPEELEAFSRAMSDCHIMHAGFTESTVAAKEGDLVYFDPPYDVPLGGHMYTQYVLSGFGPGKQELLAREASRLAKRGVYVMVSNSNTPAVREMYRGFNIEEVAVRRSIGGSRDVVMELIITGKGHPPSRRGGRAG